MGNKIVSAKMSGEEIIGDYFESLNLSSSSSSDHCELFDLLPNVRTKSCEEFREQYQFINTLGSGSFGAVNEYIDMNSGEKVAIKLLEYKEGADWIYEREYTVLQALQEIGECMKNVMCYVDHFIIEECPDSPCVIAIVMENIEGLSLKKILQTQKLTSTQIKKIFCGIVSGLMFLHAKGIVHRDLHPGNIMIREDMTPVIVDFGLSCQPVLEKCSDTQANITITNPEYIIKVLQNKTTDSDFYNNDIYAILLILYQMITGSPSSPIQAFTEKIKPLIPKGNLDRLQSAIEGFKIKPLPDNFFGLDPADYLNGTLPTLGELMDNVCI